MMTPLLRKPVYLNTSLHLFDLRHFLDFLGDDPLRWPDAFWFDDHGKSIAYYLAEPYTMAWFTRRMDEMRRAKPNGYAATLPLWTKVLDAVAEAWTPELYAIHADFCKEDVPAPAKPPRCPSWPLEEEVQVAAFLLSKTVANPNGLPPLPDPPTEALTGSPANRYFPAGWMASEEKMVEYVDRNLAAGFTIPASVLLRHGKRLTRLAAKAAAGRPLEKLLTTNTPMTAAELKAAVVRFSKLQPR